MNYRISYGIHPMTSTMALLADVSIKYVDSVERDSNQQPVASTMRDFLPFNLGSSGNKATRPPPPSVADSQAASSSTSAERRQLLLQVNPYLAPIMEPFVEGLREPFDTAWSGVRRNVLYVVIATGITCSLVGFLAGLCLGRSSSRKRK